METKEEANAVLSIAEKKMRCDHVMLGAEPNGESGVIDIVLGVAISR